MNSLEFVDAIKMRVVEGAIRAIKSNLENPPGRKPSQKLVELSNWYNQLDEAGKNSTQEIVRESVDMSVFIFLCVLDGVSVIEPIGEKGTFKLFFEKYGESVLLNSPDEEFLHDLFK